MFSKIVFALSLLAVFVAILATAGWIWVVAEWNNYGFISHWTEFGFMMVLTPAIAGVLLLAVVPSSVLFFRGQEYRDRISFWLAVCAFSLMLVEIIIVIWVIPKSQ